MSAPRLYERNTSTFTNNGFGILGDAVSYEVSETINGKFELTLEYPVTGAAYNDIQINRILYGEVNPYGDLQPFRIYRITKPLAGIITVYAEHKGYELSGYPCKTNDSYIETPGSCSQYMQYLTAQVSEVASALSMPTYSFATDIVASENWSIPQPISIREAMTQAQGIFGGEWQYNGDTCTLYANRGQDRGVQVRYGTNLTAFTQGEDTSDTFTHLMPYWTDGTEEVYINNTYLILSHTTAAMQKRVKILDLSGAFVEKPTPAELEAEARASEEYLKPHEVELTYDVQFVPLGQTTQYAHLLDTDHVELGDTVGVKVPILGIDAQARANKLVYDGLRGRYKTVTLGTIPESITSSLRASAQRTGVNVFTSVNAPTEKMKSGDYWIKIDNDTTRNAISVGRYTGGNWLLLCKFAQGGTPVVLPKVTASPTRPTAVIDGDCLAMVSGTTLTALKRLTSGEWTDVPFDYGSNPGTLHTEGTYYGWFNNGELVAIYVYENSTIKQVAPGENSLYINDVPENEASVGDYWLNIDSAASRNLYEVQRLEQGENAISWVTLYNVAVPAVYVQANEPSGAGIKPNTWWIQTGGQSFYDKTIVAVKQYEANYGWVTRCTPGGSGDLTINIDYAIVVDKGNVI